MKQFQVPQFITIEDKVIGPLTVKQFMYLAAGGLLIIVLRSFLATFVLIPLAVVLGGAAVALAFLKINGQPLPIVAKQAFVFFIHPKLYVWRKEQSPKPGQAAPEKKQETTITDIPKISASKLSDLAWSLDIKEQIREDAEQQKDDFNI